MTTRLHGALTRACWSDKSGASAARCMSWTTPAGVSRNHTPLFCGRTIEQALVSIWAPTFRIALGKSILSIIGSLLPFYLCITPAGRAVLGDRAFHRDALKYPTATHT